MPYLLILLIIIIIAVVVSISTKPFKKSKKRVHWKDPLESIRIISDNI